MIVTISFFVGHFTFLGFHYFLSASSLTLIRLTAAAYRFSSNSYLEIISCFLSPLTKPRKTCEPSGLSCSNVKTRSSSLFLIRHSSAAAHREGTSSNGEYSFLQNCEDAHKGTESQTAKGLETGVVVLESCV